MANEPPIPFSIVSDLFKLIDINSDNRIDLTEWIQTFS